MKKFLKMFAASVLTLICVFTFTACGTKLSETSADYSGTIYNGTLTNGGASAYYDGYLYFINGTATNDGTNLTGVQTGAICKVKIADDGTIDEDTYEIVIDSLVGYDYGAIHIFGDFLYYTTPNSAVNKEDTVLYYQTRFMRYDLVNKKSYRIYTTQQNSSSETISYAYYVVGDELDLVVYESTNATVTSIKIDDTFTTNYVIEDVTSCVLSETYGSCVTSGATVDANNFVFYTTSYSDTDAIKATKVYRTSPNTNNSERIYDANSSISILSIRNGKLYYTITSTAVSDSVVYAKLVTGSNDVLDENGTVMSYYSYTNIIFYSGSVSGITAIVQDSSSYEISFIMVDDTNELNISSVFVNSFSESVTFVGLVTLSEEVESDDEDDNSEDGTEIETNEPTYDEVLYLIYIDSSNIMYKIEVMRNNVITTYEDPIKLSKSAVESPTNYLSPEIVGDYIYFFASEVDEDDETTGYVYLHRTDITITEDAEDYATIIGMSESE